MYICIEFDTICIKIHLKVKMNRSHTSNFQDHKSKDLRSWKFGLWLRFIDTLNETGRVTISFNLLFIMKKTNILVSAISQKLIWSLNSLPRTSHYYLNKFYRILVATIVSMWMNHLLTTSFSIQLNKKKRYKFST